MGTAARLIPYVVAAVFCALPMFLFGYREMGIVGITITIGALVGVWISLFATDHWELDSWLHPTLREYLRHMALSVPLALILALLFVPIGSIVGLVIGLLVRNAARVAGYDV
jgi:uncharacterized membrane-anchored protein YitT (DUF2179 family)